MCLEDIRIQRQTQSSQTTRMLSGQVFPLVSQNAFRTALVISAPTSGTVTLSHRSDAVSGEGVLLSAGMAPLVLTLLLHGDLITKGLYAVADAGTPLITFWETTYNGT